MGNYISFDRKAAEGYARALRKQRQREQQAAEEASVWKELVEEDLAKKRMASAVIKQPKKHREIDITNELQHHPQGGDFDYGVWSSAVATQLRSDFIQDEDA